MCLNTSMTPTPSLIIIGASGDLTRRLLMPALYRLELAGKLPPLKIVGYALEDWTPEYFRGRIESGLLEFEKQVDLRAWETFARRLEYHSGDLSVDKIRALEPFTQGEASFYLALPPGVFAAAAQGLGEAGYSSEEKGPRRLIIEKPFGTDLKSALELQSEVVRHWKESQILRIDHFLGKETVQNLMVFRFANTPIEHLWNNRVIEEVQITAAETLGLEGRYKYYDQAGALKDMLQNHLMQMFTLVAMEPPPIWDADVIRTHKVEVLKSVRPITPENVHDHALRGQYAGYLEEPGILPSSRTETYAALKLYVDNWRWKGVPFYLRSGKKMGGTYTEIALKFREAPTRLFTTTSKNPLEDNWLVFQVKPDETIDLILTVKKPGLDLSSRHVSLHNEYEDGHQGFDAYDQLLLDALEGDRTHFLRMDEVEWAWKILTPVLENWSSGTPVPYDSGSSGPEELAPKGGWRPLRFVQPD